MPQHERDTKYVPVLIQVYVTIFAVECGYFYVFRDWNVNNTDERLMEPIRLDCFDVNCFVLFAEFYFFIHASGQGFEPRFTESESVVLPLDDPDMGQKCAITPKAERLVLLPTRIFRCALSDRGTYLSMSFRSTPKTVVATL